ncbi:MAG: HAMP domain-containing protein [Pseudomonadales bacterium]|nr:HAMP domain-containing protein [Pseudomonadales bacterium]
MKFQGSLLVRTNVVLGLAAIAIAAVSLFVISQTVITPIVAGSAKNRAALMVLTARDWANISPEQRPYFELDVLRESELIISNPPLKFERFESPSRYNRSLVENIEALLGQPVEIQTDEDHLWVEIPVSNSQTVQVGFASELRDAQEVYIGIVLLVAGEFILLLTSFLLVGRIARPLVHVAEAAASFRGTEPFEPLPEEGPKELQVLVRSFNEMARDVTELLSNRTVLLGGISHDLRTPLARMRLNLELIKDNLSQTEVERLSNNLQQMEDLVRQALEYVHASSESLEPTCLHEIVTSVVASFDPEIPMFFNGDKTLEVPLAQGSMVRVLENLLENARVHADQTSVRVDVAWTAATIHVIDRGPGIPEAYRTEVFQPFFRIENARTRRSGGSGLGLAIVSQLCQSHGWRVEIAPGESGGTDVSVEVPLN